MGIPVIEVNPERTPLSEQRDDLAARNGGDRAARPVAAPARAPRLTRRQAGLTARPIGGLRDRHRHPRGQHPLAPGFGHLEPGADDRPLGVPVGVTVAQQSRPHRRVGQPLHPRPRARARRRARGSAARRRAQESRRVGAERYPDHRPSTAPTSTPPHRTAARCRRYCSTVSALTVTGMGAFSAASRASAASRSLGFDGDHLGDRRRVEREVGAGTRTDFEHPAGQPGQVLAPQARIDSGSRVDISTTAGRRTGCLTSSVRHDVPSAASSFSRPRPAGRRPIPIDARARYARSTPTASPGRRTPRRRRRQVRPRDQQRRDAVRDGPQFQRGHRSRHPAG